MGLLFISFLGGVLTILSPCVLPLLPVIVGGSLTKEHRSRPIIITASLALSIVLFTLLLKWSTTFIAIPSKTWAIISGSLVLILGIVTVFPNLWEHLAARLNLSGKSNQLLANSANKTNWLGSVLVGLSLGPVFSSCSPTYALILATVLPQSFGVGLINLLVYALGLSVILLLIAIFGQKLTKKLRWAANPTGWFRRGLGILFIIVGLAIITGFEKKLETKLVEQGFGITNLEESLVNDIVNDMSDNPNSTSIETDSINTTLLNIPNPIPAPELQNIQSWINSDPLTLEQLRGKVVLIDFWTYSCINCIRTLPFLKAWHETYADQGLVIIGVHAPEFAFERELKNVQHAVTDYEIAYPVALDNDFYTWRAYNNHYWPAKYFIDREGNLRHYHFGEGEYEASEQVIQYLLNENSSATESTKNTISEDTPPPISAQQTPETYLGYDRAKNFVNANELTPDTIHTYTIKEKLLPHEWSLGGDWTIYDEKAVAESDNSILRLNFTAKSVYLVMGTTEESAVKVKVNTSEEKIIQVKNYRLYDIVDANSIQENQIVELQFTPGVEIHAFTFGS